MRLTERVYAQHLGWMFKKHWQVQGKRSIGKLDKQAHFKELPAEIIIKDVCSFADYKERNYMPDIFNTSATKVNNIQSLGYVLLDTNMFSQGLDQALFLSKAININSLPRKIEKSIENTLLSNRNHENIKEGILESYYFDSQQEKKATPKNSIRRAFVPSRTYGITDARQSQLLVSKLISECEKIAGNMITANRKIANDDNSVVFFEKDGDSIQLHIKVENMISSKHPLQAVREKYEDNIPDLYPMNHTVSIPRKPISTSYSSYLHRHDCRYSNPHTIFLHFSPNEVINQHETPISSSQFQARNLLKAFGVAISKARQMYGHEKKQLPEPVVIQTIQTDGKTFHFGIFQLNTLELNGPTGIKNYWFNTSNIDLFNFCGRGMKQTFVDGYNKTILNIISAFYNNC